MKKRFTILIAAIAAIMLVIQPKTILGQSQRSDSWTWTASSGDLGTSTSYSATLNGKSWSVTRSSVVYTGWSSSCIQLGSSSGAETVTLKSSAIPGTIDKIEVECSSYSAKHSVSIKVNGTTYLASTATASWTTVSKKSGTGSSSGEIEIKFTPGSSARAVYIKSIKVDYTVGDTYSVTYDANGGTIGSVPTDASEYAEGESVTVKNRNTLDHTTLGFVGWNTQDDGLGTFYHPGATFTMGSANVTLYAVWTTRCAFAYDDNGADGGEIPDSYYTSYGTGAKVVVLGNTGELEKDAAVWDGWNTADDGSGTSYQEGESFIINSDVTLYAKWRDIPTYTLVTSTSQITPGAHYVIASSKTAGSANAMDEQNGKIRDVKSTTITVKDKDGDSEDDIYIEDAGVYEFVISGYENNYTIYDETNETPGYLYHNGDKDIKVKTSIDNSAKWKITFSSDAVVITNVSATSYSLQYNSGSPRYTTYSSSQTKPFLYKKDNDNDIIYYSPTTISTPVTITTPTTISNGGVLDMGSNALSIGVGGSLTIEDGGQLITTSAVSATVKQSITSATSKDDVYGWYTISSPVNGVNITANTNLISNTYNLLRYNEEEMLWENYGNPAYSSFDNTLENGRGYLYRNSEDITLEYSGTINNSTVAYTVTKHDVEYEGFNLIGNPYTHDIYKGTGSAVPNTGVSGYELASGFYTLTKAAEWHACEDNVDAIKSGQGFLVKATTGGEIVMSNVTTGGPAKGRANHDNIKFVVENNQYSDVAYAVFDKGYGLNKINHRNPNSPMVYIPQVDDNYAIAMMSDDNKSFDLNFQAMTMGQYTLSIKANGMFDYIHLIDRLTGKDIDMLLEGKYTFIGTPSDSDNRFIVKLAYNTCNTSSMDESFAYQSGNDIYVTGSGELQIFDVTGRQVMATTISGTESINLSAKGVFIFRLIGNDVKTQKIVVE